MRRSFFLSDFQLVCVCPRSNRYRTYSSIRAVPLQCTPRFISINFLDSVINIKLCLGVDKAVGSVGKGCALRFRTEVVEYSE